ncbi:inositol monophosphatase family protein [Microvirga sp. G4-2]|uniref:inositol monophosphatase family protein n=1 Tax=Microvirga sp. G4-2 TaxID=3434467 RepID=UPI004043ABAE
MLPFRFIGCFCWVNHRKPLPLFQPALALTFHLKREDLHLTGDHLSALEPFTVAKRANRHLLRRPKQPSPEPQALPRHGSADRAFLVDPVDGTKNFASGLPLFGVMVAAVVRGEVMAGWIHDPVGNDTAITVRREGAWIEHPNGKRADLRIAP